MSRHLLICYLLLQRPPHLGFTVTHVLDLLFEPWPLIRLESQNCLHSMYHRGPYIKEDLHKEEEAM